VIGSVSVKRRRSQRIFDAHSILAKTHKKESASNEDFLVDAQFHMALRQVDAVISHSRRR